MVVAEVIQAFGRFGGVLGFDMAIMIKNLKALNGAQTNNQIGAHGGD
jgi:hypothetical protein